MNKMYFGDFSKLKKIECKNPDLERQIFYGDNIMLVKNVIPAYGVIPNHHHVHEQLTYVERGECDVILNGEQKVHAGPGSVAWFPSNADHEIIAGAKELVCWDIFTPIRKDFIETSEKTE
jgi:quercetin dioxygenase-like cupin family protein